MITQYYSAEINIKVSTILQRQELKHIYSIPTQTDFTFGANKVMLAAVLVISTTPSMFL